MAKEKSRAEDKTIDDAAEGKRKLTLSVEIPEKPEGVICKVCGHKNTGDTGMCAMCSNYLFN